MQLDSPNLSEYRRQLMCRKVRHKTCRRFRPIVARVRLKVVVIKQENRGRKVVNSLGGSSPRNSNQIMAIVEDVAIHTPDRLCPARCAECYRCHKHGHCRRLV